MPLSNATSSPSSFAFADLDQRAQKRALDWARECTCQDQWWDFVYEDVVATAACFGLEISHRAWRGVSGHTGTEPEIYFTGFYCQGSGASFHGTLRLKPDAPEQVRAHAPQEEVLHRLVDKLTSTWVLLNARGEENIYVHITSTKNLCLRFDWGFDDPFRDDTEQFEEVVRECMDDFANWIYKQLEAEYEYQTSDETLTEWLKDSDYRFDEDGRII